MRKLNRGSVKYKGNLPFKCFNYGKVGYYASKYLEKKDYDPREKFKKVQNIGRKLWRGVSISKKSTPLKLK